MKEIIGQDRQKWLVIIFVIIFIAAVVGYFLIGPAKIKSVLKGAFEPLFFWNEKAVVNSDHKIDVLSNIKGMESVYVKNIGQISDEKVKFYTGIGGTAKTLFTSESVLFVYTNKRFKYSVISGDLSRPSGRDRSNDRFIIDKGGFQSDNIETYKKVVYTDVYEDINLEFISADNGEKSTFVVGPGADYTKIITHLEGDGLELVGLKDDGRIEYALDGSTYYDEAPVCYQLDNVGKKTDVECVFLLDKAGNSSFRVYEYDKTRNLYIDPVMTATIIAASDTTKNEFANDITVNTSNGEYYIVGNTIDVTNFVGGVDINEGGVAGAYDVFVVKFDTDENKLWTYIAGSFGANSDYANAVDWVNDGGEAIYVGGYTNAGATFTSSRTTEGTASAMDGFVIKLDENGSRQWTYIAGGQAGTNENINDLIVKPDTNKLLAVGYTNAGNNFVGGGGINNCPASSGDASDLFVLDLATNNAARNNTFVSGADLDDIGTGIDYDSNNNVYVSGRGQSVDMCDGLANSFEEGVSDAASQAAYVLKLDSGLNPLAVFEGYSSAGLDDRAYAIAVDRANGNIVYAAGATADASNFCNASNRVIQGALGVDDVFILQLDSNLTRLRTFLGGSFPTQADGAQDIKVDSAGELTLAGYSSSGASFGGLNNREEAGTLSSDDLFVMKLDWQFVDIWTYIGGSGNGGIERANAVDIRGIDEFYIAGYTGDSANFLASGGSQDLFGTRGVYDAFAFVLEDIVVGAASVATNPENNLGMSGAMLNGNITDTGGGFIEERGFEYGLTINYTASSTEVGTFGTGAYFLPVSGLNPNTLYHFRAYVINANGRYFGADRSFTTKDSRQVFLNSVGTAGSEKYGAMTQTSDGGYIVVGTTNNYGDPTMPQPYAAKYDSSGYSQWTRTYSGLGVTEIQDVSGAGDGGYVITGSTYTSTDGRQMIVIKLDENGYYEWSNSVGPTN